MINTSELRLGNYVLHKTGVRILPFKCTFQHFDLLAKGQEKDFFPVALKPEILKKCGFVENEQYYQFPEVKEFILTLPVKSPNKNEIRIYIAKETYGRATVNDHISSNHFYHLHQLQNIYFALTGAELDIIL